MKTIPEAGGSYGSRKFILTLLGLFLVTALAAMGAFFPAVPAILPTFVGGVLGVLSLYFTGNVVNKYVVGKTMVQVENQSDNGIVGNQEAGK